MGVEIDPNVGAVVGAGELQGAAHQFVATLIQAAGGPANMPLLISTYMARKLMIMINQYLEEYQKRRHISFTNKAYNYNVSAIEDLSNEFWSESYNRINNTNSTKYDDDRMDDDGET